jgi:hypothetical protein
MHLPIGLALGDFFDAINPAVTIVVHAADPSKLDGKCLTFPMVNWQLPAESPMFHICGVPIGAPQSPKNKKPLSP